MYNYTCIFVISACITKRWSYSKLYLFRCTHKHTHTSPAEDITSDSSEIVIGLKIVLWHIHGSWGGDLNNFEYFLSSWNISVQLLWEHRRSLGGRQPL